MGGKSGEQGARAMAAKTGFRHAPGGANSHHPELGEEEGMAGHAEWRQHVVAQARPGAGEGLEEGAPGFAVAAQIGGRARDGTLQYDGATVVEGVGQWSVRVHPLEAVGGQRKLLEARRADGQRVHSGADLVDKSGKGARGRPGAAADG